MMADKFDHQALELLPCECDGFLYVDGVAMKAHTVCCPAYYRHAVAGVLRESGDKVIIWENRHDALANRYDQLDYLLTENYEKLTQAQASQAHYERLWKESNENAVKLQPEIVKLRNDFLQAQAEIERLKAERDDLDYRVSLYRQNHEDAEALRTQLAEAREIIAARFPLSDKAKAWLATNRERGR